MWRPRSTRRATLAAQILAVALMLVLAGCALQTSDESYTRSDVQRAFEAQGITLLAFGPPLDGQRSLVPTQARYRGAVSVMVWERGRPEEFGIRVLETSRIVNDENVMVTYEPSKVSADVITAALAELKRQ